MEKNLNNLKQQVDSLAKRIQKANDNKTISSIEIDIILEQLRTIYIVAEEIKELTILDAKKKSLEASPLEDLSETPLMAKHPEIFVTVPPMPITPKSEKVTPDSPEEDPEEPFTLPGQDNKTPVYIHEIPEIEKTHMPPVISAQENTIEQVSSISVPTPEMPFEPAPVSIEDIPVMKFAEIEVTKQAPVNEPGYPSVPVQEPVQHQVMQSTPSQEPVQYSVLESTPVQEAAYNSIKQSTPVQEPPKQAYYTAPDQIAPPQQTSSVSHQSDKTTVKSNDLFANQTLADKFKKETPSLNEKIIQGREDHTLAHKMQLKPISDLKTAIGINEKFQLVNDLFQGRIDLYNDAINRLNTCGSSYSAEGILESLKSSHNWKEETEAYGKLRTFISRRYLS